MIWSHSLKGPPPSPFREQPPPPLHPKAYESTPPHTHPQANWDREEVKLASDRGCEAAAHAHSAGRHQEVKLPRHGLQQRSARTRRWRAAARPERTRRGVEDQERQRDGAGPRGKRGGELTRRPVEERTTCDTPQPPRGRAAREQQGLKQRHRLAGGGGPGARGCRLQEAGLAQGPLSVGQGSPSCRQRAQPASFALLSLTSYTPQNTDMNLLRMAAQMLAM